MSVRCDSSKGGRMFQVLVRYRYCEDLVPLSCTCAGGAPPELRRSRLRNYHASS